MKKQNQVIKKSAKSKTQWVNTVAFVIAVIMMVNDGRFFIELGLNPKEQIFASTLIGLVIAVLNIFLALIKSNRWKNGNLYFNLLPFALSLLELINPALLGGLFVHDTVQVKVMALVGMSIAIINAVIRFRQDGRL